MQILFGLIIVNVLMFFIGRVMAPEAFQMLILSWAGLRLGFWWQVVSSMFMHGSFFHLLFNMWGLYIFGQLIVNGMGTWRFLLLYFISGITGNLIWLVFNMNSGFFLLGASGALFGVMLGAAMFRPNVRFMMLFFPIPIRTKTLVVVYAIIEIISEWNNIPGMRTNIAHLVHLGGFVGAYIYLKVMYGHKMEWDPLGFLRRGRGMEPMRASDLPPPPRDIPDAGMAGGEISQQQVDRILDKLSRHGANSLSDEDRAVLNEARKRYGKH